MDRKDVKGLSLEEARRELEKDLKPGEDALYYDLDRFGKPREAPPSDVVQYAPPQHVKVPEPLADTTRLDVTAPHVIARRRLAGRHYTKEILLSIGIIGVVTFFAWIFLRAQAESSPRRPVPPAQPAVVVAPAAPSPREVPTATLPPTEQPKTPKP